MTSAQEDRYGMFLKTDLFLVTYATDLAFNPAIATTRTSLNSFINLIAQSDSTATRDITGFTAAKNEHKAQQIAQLKLIRAALMGYYTAAPDIKAKTIINFPNSEIDKFRDAELYMKTDQVLDLALPIKATLGPYGVAAAQVDALDTLNGIWQSLEPIGRQEGGVNKAASEDVLRYMDSVTDLLNNTLDSYMQVVEYNNPNLYSQYQTARMIDDSGGGSDSAGYDVQNVTVPANGSVIFSPFPGAIPPGLDLYLRAINGNVVVCTTDLPASPCAAGYMLTQGVTFKGLFSTTGVDMSKTNIQFTNSGMSDVVVRAGGKGE